MALTLGKLGEQKVTVPLAVLVGLLVIGWQAKDFTIEGLDEFFFSEAQGEELAKAVKANTEVISAYIRRQEIRDVNEQIEAANSQIQETNLWIAANGDNPIATARLAELNTRLTRLTNKKSCLLNDNISDKAVCDDA